MLLNQSIPQLLKQASAHCPDAEAFVFCQSNSRLTWRSLDEQATRQAAGWLKMGLKPGDHVGIWGTNVPEWVVTQMAAAKLGCPLVTINPEWKASELDFAITQSRCRLLVMIDGFSKKTGDKTFHYDYVDMLRSFAPHIFTQSTSEHSLKWVVLIGTQEISGLTPWDRVMDVSPEFVHRVNETPVTPERVALIQYTSGTTGFPKGAMLTHHSVVNNAKVASDTMGLTSRDRLCGPVPFYHCFGSILVNLVGLVSQATVVIPADRFDAHVTLEAVAKEKCTALHGVPTMFIGEIDDPMRKGLDLSSLRTGIMAGAPCPVELMKHVIDDLGAKELTIGYGLTEASPLTHQTRPDDDLLCRTSTVGKPITGTQSKIVDPQSLAELPNGQVGEIWVKGHHVMLGYYERPEETAKAIVDGWLRTGDLGFRDEHGYFHISGRLKELIIVGGHNVYPAEIEQSIMSMYPDVIEMVQVVGLPHTKLQEVVGAAIQLAPGADLDPEQLKTRCKEVMEWPKVPRQVLIVHDFSKAMTVTGKVQKHKIRDWFDH